MDEPDQPRPYVDALREMRAKEQSETQTKRENVPEAAAPGSGLKRFLGFVLGFAAMALFEVLVIVLLDASSGRQFMPGGPGWLFIPIFMGLAGAKWLPSARLSTTPFADPLKTALPLRLAVAIYVAWALVYLGYYVLAQPYLYGSEIVTALLVPPTVLIGLLALGWWVSKGQSRR